jgi:hypothetical protein
VGFAAINQTSRAGIAESEPALFFIGLASGVFARAKSKRTQMATTRNFFHLEFRNSGLEVSLRYIPEGPKYQIALASLHSKWSDRCPPHFVARP